MPNKMKLAKKLLQNDDFKNAKQILERKEPDIDSLYLLSLLYRYDDEYDQEAKVVNKALAIDCNHKYFLERQEWYRLSYFDRTVPRQSLYLPRDPKAIPSQATLDQMCFVTWADSRYFQLVVELIESIRATQLYKGIPICVLDYGLLKDEKEYLLKNLNVQSIKSPAKSDELTQRVKETVLAVMFTSLDKTFPGYQYYFYMKPSTWIQDERAIDRYLKLSQKYGIGAAQGCKDSIMSENMKFSESLLCNQKNIPEEYWNLMAFKNTPFVNTDILCINAEYKIFDKYTSYLKSLTKILGPDMLQSHIVILHLLCAELEITEVTSLYDNHQILCYPDEIVWVEEDNILKVNDRYKTIIGCVNLTGNPDYTTYPNIFALDIKTCQQKEVSCRYRVLPWQDKPQVFELLLSAMAL